MKLEGDYFFEATVPEVWSALFDPMILAAVMPGCEKLDLVDGQYVGEIKVKVGPIQGKFTGKVDLKDKVEPESYTMVVDGRGAPGFVKATAAVKLAAEGNGTRVSYDTEAQVGGKIASVGQRLLEASARAIVAQSLEGLHTNIKLRAAAYREAAAKQAAAPAAPTPVSATEPPESTVPAAGHPAGLAEERWEEPTVKSAELAARWEEPTVKNPGIVTKWEEPTAKSPAALAKSAELAAKPNEDSVEPVEPFGEPTEPSAKAGELSARSGELSAKSGELPAKSVELSAKSVELSTKPAEAAAKAPEASARPAEASATPAAAASVAAAPAVEFTPVKVKQSALANAVAKEVASSLFPRSMLVAIIVLQAAVIVWLLVRH
jgi:carbon monoxide dehydrogenase subunit G